MFLSIIFLITILLAAIFTNVIRKLALKLKIVDHPDQDRKRHEKPIALLGGMAIFLCFWLVLGYIWFFTDKLGQNINAIQLLSMFLSSSLLMTVGFFDDRYNLNAKLRLVLVSISAILVIIFAIDLSIVTNPLGGNFKLDWWQWSCGWASLSLIGDLVVFAWIMGMMFTVKILDGLDGLATGITAIGALMIFFLASTSLFYQADVRIISLILVGACLGFLIFNFYPAKIFLGEGGGLFLGFILGVLAVVAGGKIATALLVMAIPILDLAWVIYRRLKSKQSIFEGDRQHVFFRVVDAGMSQPKTVLFLYLISFLFGISTLILPSKLKILALLLLVALFLIGEKFFIKYVHKNKTS
ncbi:MAG: MraY family glycosyltransferase [bacterium]